MPLYRLADVSTLVPFEATPFPGLEKQLEDWIEANPHILLGGETIAIIARQPWTAHGKFSDLLGIDAAGACVIIELKRGETPRDVVAQALEYAAWVDALSDEQLDELARAYAVKQGLAVDGVADLYRRAFAGEDDAAGDGIESAAHVTFNYRQRLVIVAERFHPEVEQTLRYLRTKHGVDIAGVRVGVHTAGGATIVETDVIVGREQAAAAKQASPSTGGGTSEADEAIHARVTSPFVKAAVTAIEDWVAGIGDPTLTVRHGPLSDHFLQIGGKTQLYYYYAREWVFANLYHATGAESERLKALSKPESLKPSGSGLRFHLTSDADLQRMQAIVLARLAAAKAN